MKQRIITGFLFTLAILGFVVLGYWNPLFLAAMWMIVFIIGTKEMISCIRNKKINPGVFLSYLGAGLAFLPVIMSYFTKNTLLVLSTYSMGILMLSLLTLILIVLTHPSEHAFSDGLATSSIQIYMSFPLACANIMLFSLPKGWYFFIMALFAPWISDVFAYFTGVLIGKRKIVPHISPKKTLEGCIGGAVGTAFVLTIYYNWIMIPFLDQERSVFSFVLGLIAGFVLSVLSQFGDWLASAIKRWAGVKDFGNILPGHGGILDRFDSVFFTLPLTLLLVYFLR